MPHFLSFEIYPMWGYSIRIGPESKGRIAYLYPPPTTIMGAFLASLERVLGERKEILLSENASYAEKYRKIIENVYISVSKLAVKVFGDPIKYLSNYKGKEIKSNVIAAPSTFTVSKGRGKSKIMAILEMDVEKAKEMGIERRELERAAWGIWRLGSKESIVSTENVNWLKGEEVNTNSVETFYAFPYKGDLKVDVNKVYLQRVVDWRKAKIGEYIEVKKVYLAYPLTKVKVSAEGLIRCYKLENGELLIRG